MELLGSFKYSNLSSPEVPKNSKNPIADTELW